MCSVDHVTDAPFIDFDVHEFTKSIAFTGLKKKPLYLLVTRKDPL